MKLNRILGIALLLFNSIAYSQVDHPESFISFSSLNEREKYVYLINNNWIARGTDRGTKDGRLTESMYFYTELNGTKFFLTLKTTLGSDYDTHATILSINNESTYNLWFKQMQEAGYEFQKDPNGGEKYIVLNEDDFIIYAEKRKVKDVKVFEISIIR